MSLDEEVNTYEKRRELGDRHLNKVRSIVGYFTTRESPFTKDVQEATDLVILRGRAKDTAVRVRRHKYLKRYPHDFTLRAQTHGGGQSEVEKICRGYADRMFYGWMNEEGDDIKAWMFLDLDAFRYALQGCEWRDKYDTGTKPNGDGSALRYFDVRSLPDDVLIHRDKSEEQMESPPVDPAI
jgi:hypothetical protein